MISEQPVAGFLITNGRDFGTAIELLRQYSRESNNPGIRNLADRLDDVPIGVYHEREQ
jgi:hypothetical protein